MGFWSDFKKFISKGNIVDLATAVVIGNAFNKIVTGLVNNIIMPVVSLAVGGLNVSDWKYVIKDAVLNEAGEVVDPMGDTEAPVQTDAGEPAEV